MLDPVPRFSFSRDVRRGYSVRALEVPQASGRPTHRLSVHYLPLDSNVVDTAIRAAHAAVRRTGGIIGMDAEWQPETLR
jgi:hypothetical protein